MRPGELAALECKDVNLDRGYITVRRSLDLRTGLVKGLKTTKNGVPSRQIPIRLELRPLLQIMMKEVGGVGRLITSDAPNRTIEHGMPPVEDLAATLQH